MKKRERHDDAHMREMNPLFPSFSLFKSLFYPSSYLHHYAQMRGYRSYAHAIKLIPAS